MFKEILEDPIGVGSCLALRVGNTHNVASRSEGCHHVLGADEGIDLWEVTPKAWALTVATCSFGRANLQLDPINLQQADTGISAFYLPWGSHQTYRLSLKSDHGVRLFFTAPLDGCAIVVEGTPENPVVYHANANELAEEVSPMGNPDVLEVVALKLLEKRNQAMFSACRAFPGDLDSFSDAMQSGAITPLEYGVLIGRPSEAAEKRAVKSNWSQPEWRRKSGWSKAPKEWTFTKSWGSVYGVRSKNGAWAFYRQKIVELKEGDFVLSCEEFWPSGFSRRTF